MRAIAKGPEPESLIVHRKQPHSDYGNYAEKDDLRHALVKEQRGLCCYCMGPISPGSACMKIEHWRCQADYPKEQLTYQNLLGACLGAQGKPPRHQHCDTRKENRDLAWNPANPAHHIELRLRYESDGSIRANDSNFHSQLCDVLNLNLPMLKNNRKVVLSAVLEWWEDENRLRGPVPRDRLVRKREEYVEGTGDLEPYCQVAVHWLEWMLAGMKS